MEAALLEIIAAVRADEDELDDVWLDRLVRRHNRDAHDGSRQVAKKRLLPYYLDVKENDPARWESWGVDAACEERLVRLLRTKPRRTASGVATITVLTKPWPCTSDCVYCPNDVRMPKSYLADEPACQRAEQNFFDPYLQAASRLRTLEAMGHVTDKVELIVLGGTWNDYPEDYRIWFVAELFRALNDAGKVAVPSAAAAEGEAGDVCGDAHGEATHEAPDARVGTIHDTFDVRDTACGPVGARDTANACGGKRVLDAAVREREDFYRAHGITSDPDVLAEAAGDMQQAVDAGKLSYNEAVVSLYRGGAWARVAQRQQADLAELDREHRANEDAAHRVVGLVVETRPDLVTPENLALMRRLGCTKVQMGIQSLDAATLARNERDVSLDQIKRAFALTRMFGFKIHVHAMVNLLGTTPDADKADYLRLVQDEAFRPDEVKLYPCALVESARLTGCYDAGEWVPYSEDELLDVLAHDVRATPSYMRISRMVRDISAGDIVAGNKKANLRQLVEQRLREEGAPISEMRFREIATDAVSPDDLELQCVGYRTTVGEERFLQWVTSEGRIAGFLRLSLPDADAAATVLGADVEKLPVRPGEAMIRELHVYGKVACLHGATEDGAQHTGLGRRLMQEACDQARAAGFDAINVISSVGTRNYYRRLGFQDAGLYQRMVLDADSAAEDDLQGRLR